MSDDTKIDMKIFYIKFKIPRELHNEQKLYSVIV